MTTDFHTPIATGAPANAVIWNTVFEELDEAIGDIALPFLQNNLLINGGFDVWQKGTSDTIGTFRATVADRWGIIGGAGVLSVSRSTEVPSGGRSNYSMEIEGNPSTTTVNIDQRIEAYLSPLYKREVSFSAYIYNDTGAALTPKLLVSTPSAEDDWTTSTVRNGGGSGEDLQECADDAWTQISWTADISGYTDIDNGVEFEIYISSLEDDEIIRLAEVNVLPYSSPYPFEPRLFIHELFLCQRYLIVIPSGLPFAHGFVESSSYAKASIPIPVPMRTTPDFVDVTAYIHAAGSEVSASSISNIQLFSDRVVADFNDSGTSLSADYAASIEHRDPFSKDAYLDAEL